MKEKEQIDKLLKKKKITPSWCGKCLGNLEIRYIPVGKGTGLIILYGICNKCKLVVALRILKKGEVFAVDYIQPKNRYYYTTKKSSPKPQADKKSVS